MTESQGHYNLAVIDEKVTLASLVETTKGLGNEAVAAALSQLQNAVARRVNPAAAMVAFQSGDPMNALLQYLESEIAIALLQDALTEKEGEAA